MPDRNTRHLAAHRELSEELAVADRDASIGDPDMHRQYSSLFKRLRGRRLQVQFNNGGLPQAE